VLTGWERIPVCVAYDVDGRRFDEWPATMNELTKARPIYEYFHIVKNFNEKVICKVKRTSRQGLDKGSVEAARALKHSTYLLQSSADTRKRKERDALEGRLVSRGSALFGKQEVLQRGGARKRYKGLISQNELPSACNNRV
ncbi:MAG: adenylosuccinate synthetase, partial [Coriobacteriaceae bacterium]